MGPKNGISHSVVVENFFVLIVNSDVDSKPRAHEGTFFVRITAHRGVKNLDSIHPLHFLKPLLTRDLRSCFPTRC
jgi:hypothetical protein